MSKEDRSPSTILTQLTSPRRPSERRQPALWMRREAVLSIDAFQGAMGSAARCQMVADEEGPPSTPSPRVLTLLPAARQRPLLSCILCVFVGVLSIAWLMLQARSRST